MKIKTNFDISDFICPECSNVMTLSRRKSHIRKLYNQKIIWSHICTKDITHIKLRDIDILEKKLEFMFEMSESEKKYIN